MVMMPYQIWCDYLEDRGFDTRLLRTQEPLWLILISAGVVSSGMWGDGDEGDGDGDGYGDGYNGINGHVDEYSIWGSNGDGTGYGEDDNYFYGRINGDGEGNLSLDGDGDSE